MLYYTYTKERGVNVDYNVDEENDKHIYLASNIKHLRLLNGSTQEQIGNICGKQNTAVANWEKGIREPDAIDLLKLSNFFNIPINILMEKDLRFDNAEMIDFDSNILKIPVYGTIKAGIPIESQNDIIDYVDIPKDWTNGGKKFYGLKISGDSMFPKYSENDIVIFEQNDDIEAYKNKDVAVMINGTESTFKKILVNEQGIVLQPYNTAYDIMMYSKEQVEQLPIKVIGIAREKRVKIS